MFNIAAFSLGDSNEIREKALICCRDHFDLLGESKFNKLQETLGICDDQFTALLNLIRSLNPRPGAACAIIISSTLYQMYMFLRLTGFGKWSRILRFAQLCG